MGLMEDGEGGSKPSMTYVQADTSNFREVVQRLTGPSQNDNDHGRAVATTKGVAGVKRRAFKLHERRQYTRTKLEIVKPPVPDFHIGHSHHQQHFSTSSSLSLSTSTSPSPSRSRSRSPSPSSSSHGHGQLARSPLGTPSSIFSRPSTVEEEEQDAVLNREEEEKANRERRFYLHPSHQVQTRIHRARAAYVVSS